MRKDCEISIRVTAELKGALEQNAEARGEAFAVVVREALREYLNRRSSLEVPLKLQDQLRAVQDYSNITSATQAANDKRAAEIVIASYAQEKKKKKSKLLPKP